MHVSKPQNTTVIPAVGVTVRIVVNRIPAAAVEVGCPVTAAAVVSATSAAAAVQLSGPVVAASQATTLLCFRKGFSLTGKIITRKLILDFIKHY